jgi:DNA-binding beta-propeller fold protein YncE
MLRGEDTVAGAFDAAAGVLVSPSGEVFVADFYNDRVVVFREDGAFDRVIGTPGRVLPGRLHYPTDLDWIDDELDDSADGLLVVADAYNNRIQLFTPGGEAHARWGGIFGLGLPGDGPGAFRVAIGIAVDAMNRIYVADFENHRIQVFTSDGQLLSIFGSPGQGPGEFEHPTDLAIGPNGRIFVVDFGNDRIQVFEALPDTLR